MLSAAEWTLNRGMPSSLAASAAWLWLTPCMPLRASSVLGPIIDSATLMGTPTKLYMSDCMSMTFGNRTLEDPVGWCATRASILLPFSLRRSARSTSPVPMSIPHIMISASISRASSAMTENLQSAYGFHRRSVSKSSFSLSDDDSYSEAASSKSLPISSAERGSFDIPVLMASS